MFFQEPTSSRIVTFVPSWITKRSFDEPEDGELFTEETGDITIAVSVFTLSDFCQAEKLKAPAESSRSTIPQ